MCQLTHIIQITEFISPGHMVCGSSKYIWMTQVCNILLILKQSQVLLLTALLESIDLIVLKLYSKL